MDVEKLRELIEAHPDVMAVCQRYAGKKGAHPFADAFASLPGLLDRLEKLERVAEAAGQLSVSMKFSLPDDKYGEVEQDRRYLERELNALAALRGDG